MYSKRSIEQVREKVVMANIAKIALINNEVVIVKETLEQMQQFFSAIGETEKAGYLERVLVKIEKAETKHATTK